MSKKSIIWLVVIIVVILAVGVYFLWGTSSSSSTSSSTSTQTSSTSSSGSTGSNDSNAVSPGANATTTVGFTLNNGGGGPYGAYLTARNGMTLYESTKDSPGISACTGSCAVTWPPYTVTAAEAKDLTTQVGIAGVIGTIHRGDGTLQVTYGGFPLYYYSGDTKVGDTKGNDVGSFTYVAPR